jgi:hypothetical protein
MGRHPRFVFCLIGIACAATSVAWGQDNGYAAIPFNGDPATLLRQRLIQAQRLDGLLRRARQLQKKLSESSVGAALLPKLDPAKMDLTKIDGKLIEDIRKHMPEEKLLAKQDVETFKGLQKELKSVALDIQKQHSERFKAPELGSGPEPAPSGEFQDRMSQWALEMLQGAEDTKIGGMIQESPAWKNAITELKELIDNPQAVSKQWNLGPDKLSLPKGLGAAFSKAWKSIRAMEMPSLPKIHLSTPDLGVSGSLSKLPVPRRWRLGQDIWWAGVALCAGLIAWQFWKRGSSRRGDAARRRLGPWPVQPACVASAADLIAAFEYLAALRLGTHVRTWNHRAIAEELGRQGAGREGAERREAAVALASLYEQARYSEQASLSLEAFAVARQNLCFLAGMGFR